jgi:hypothetical protein
VGELVMEALRGVDEIGYVATPASIAISARRRISPRFLGEEGLTKRSRRMSRPWVTLKLATSLDGRIATAAGESRWITGRPRASRCTGCAPSTTPCWSGSTPAIRDNAELTVRLPDFTGEQPARVVLDTHQRLPVTSRLVETAAMGPVMLITAVVHPFRALMEAGVKVLHAPAREVGVDIGVLMELLRDEGVERVFVGAADAWRPASSRRAASIAWSGSAPR